MILKAVGKIRRKGNEYMDHHVKEFFKQYSDDSLNGNFHKVIPLHELPDMKWEDVVRLVPNICKGWYELAHLPSKDRIEFSCEFWLSKIPYHPKVNQFLARFFGSLGEIGVFITQQKFDDPFEATLVYCLKKDNGFFRGSPPATEQKIVELQKKFPHYLLPVDYLGFLQIHDGFCKTTDCTGITRSCEVPIAYEHFQEMLLLDEPITTTKRVPVDPKTLIPFYESFGMPYYQCFWGEWYPEQEMGNVYFSGETKTISDITSSYGLENMAFPTFTDWLMFYLESIE
jgi:hypothetical protein